MSWARRHMTFANVVSLMALVLAMGGTGYALSTLPKNSVGKKQLKKNAVISSKVKNRSLKKIDFKAGQLPQGRTGPTGPSGPSGPTGPTGTFGAVTVQTERSEEIPDGGSKRVNVFCLPGERGIGGGVRGDEQDSEDTIVTSTRPAMSPDNSEPPPDGGTFTGWRAIVVNKSGGVGAGIFADVWVICVAP